MTRKELKAFINQCANVKRGYCCYSNLPYSIKANCRLIGTNSGVYGWNWSLYYDGTTDTAYIDGYRNY